MGWWYCPIKPPRVSGWVVGVVSADHHEFGLVLSWARLAPDGKTREVLCVVWVDNAVAVRPGVPLLLILGNVVGSSELMGGHTRMG